MELTIVTPLSVDHKQVSWIEVQTVTGNRIIQEGHAPILMILKENHPFIFATDDGIEELIEVIAGTLEVGRNKATLILHEK